MNWRNLKIAHKLTLIFVLCLGVFILFGSLSILRMNSIKNSAKLVSTEQLPTVEKVVELERNWQQAIFYLRSYGYSNNKQFLYDGLTHLLFTKNILGEIKSRLAYDNSISSQLQILSTELNKLSAIAHQAEKESNAETKSALVKEDQMDDGILLIQLISKTLYSKAQMAVSRNIKQASNSITFLVAGLIILIILTIIASLFLTKSFTTPIYQLVEFAKLQAKGELNHELCLNQKDEIGQLAKSIQISNTTIKEMVIRLTQASKIIKNTSDSFNSKAENLNDHAANQASSTEELTTTIEEMTSLITENSIDAQQIASINKKSTETIDREMEQTQLAMNIMNSLISKSVHVRDIALQTNILALNASIEAAKAGVHGSGFGVVAKGIRELAERAQEISSDINSISAKGKEYSSLANNSLKKIQTETEHTTVYIQKISNSALEQQNESTQIANSVTELNEATQRIAMMAEDISDGSVLLKKESQDMEEMLNFFSIDDSIQMKKRTNKTSKHSSNSIGEINKRLSHLLIPHIVPTKKEGTSTIPLQKKEIDDYVSF